MAEIAYESPDGTMSEEIAAENITDSGKVQGIRVKLEDESFVHLPYTRLYWIRMSEDEGKVNYSSA